MECPRCQSKSPVVLAEDSFKCECGRVQAMEYWYCADCNFSFRTNNKKYVDGWDLSSIIAGVAADDLKSAIEQAGDMPVENCDEPFLGFVHPCVKCGAVTTYESKPNIYRCSACGFEWELLKNE